MDTTSVQTPTTTPPVSPIPPAPKPSTVKMQNPTGEIGDVPEEKVSAATASGYVPVVQMTNPSGLAGYVPTHKSGDALKAGYKFGAPIKDASTIGPAAPSKVVSFNPADLIASPEGGIGGSPIGNPFHVDTRSLENMTQVEKAEHPILAKVGDLTAGIKELLYGGKEAGKPMGTSSGVLNNPVSQAITLAPGIAEAGAAAENLAGEALARRAATKAAQVPVSAPTVQPIKAENFVYKENPPAPQHGEPFKSPAPLDNPTIVKSLGGKDLSPEAVNTLKKHVGGTPGAEIEVGSTPKNTVIKAVEPMQKTLTETGIKMNQAIQNAPAFKSSVLADGNSTLLKDIEDLRDNLPLKSEDPLNKVFDKQVEAAYDVLNSTDPKEVLAYRRKLGSQIDWSDIRQSPETTKDAKDLVQAKIYRALGTKLHTEIPETAELDKIFQPNLELQSHLDKKLGTSISRDPVEANAQHLSELNKGKRQLAVDAHNAIVDENRKLAGLDTPSGPITGPIGEALDSAVSKFKGTNPAEQEALRKMLTPSVNAGKVFGTNTSWFDALKQFDRLTPDEQAARFSNPAQVRSTLRSEATKQVGRAVVKYGSAVAAAHALGVDRAAIQFALGGGI
jgi:heterodisulfide reductase subunit C